MGEESDEDQISDEEDGWMEASNIPISTPSSTKNSAIDPWMQAIQNSKKDAGISYWDMGKVEQESVANIIKNKQNEL